MSGQRPALWGVLNVTPDSFSDGGLYRETEAAVRRAAELRAQGAAVIDVGGESTRPGATRVEAAEEAGRVIPVVSALLAQGLTLSVDTMRASTAQLAIDAGAHYINDVSGGLADPAMCDVVAGSGCEFVMMHWRGHSADMDTHADYADVVSEVRDHLATRIEAARRAGIDAEAIIVDPGLGFGKNPDHNWALLEGLGHISDLGHRILIGASRKRFLGELLPEGHDITERDASSAALGVILAHRGVWALRVHNPLIHARALDVWQAVSRGRRND